MTKSTKSGTSKDAYDHHKIVYVKDIDIETLYSFEELEFEYLGFDKADFIEIAPEFCRDLNSTMRFLTKEITIRGGCLEDYDRLMKIVDDIIKKVSKIIEFDKNNYKLTERERNEIITRELESARKMKEEDPDCEPNPDYPEWKCSSEEMYRWRKHPLYHIIHNIETIKFNIAMVQADAEQKQTLIDSFFHSKKHNTNTNVEKNIAYFPLTTYMVATPSVIERVLTTKQPFGGSQVKWKGKNKGDALLLCEVLGFTIKQINDCFRFSDDRPLRKSNETKSKDANLRQILMYTQFFRVGNLPKNR